MRNLFLFFALLAVMTGRSASFYDQLCAFNPAWKAYADRAPNGDYQVFETDQAYIQAHLGAVISILKSNSTKLLSRDQKRSRNQLIDVLDTYRKAGNFPKNYYRSERTPVFIDEHGTHCAVGYLLMKTGHEDVAQRIAAKNNYAWVKDIKDPSLPIWQEESGFTLAELKLIQGAYDSYMENALFLWNRYEIPQRPAVMETYFSNQLFRTIDDTTNFSTAIWCYGEGENGVLNGKWIQNYTAELPWIIGFYEDGKRAGKWAEYYQGTNQLCRTEHWCDDKLNGVRTRFDREGKIIEEIIFEDGEALLKTNFDLEQGLRWERTPRDSNRVFTKVYNDQNMLIAKGAEEIYNPGNLLWFQNIELTVLNTISIASRDEAPMRSGSHAGLGLNFQQIPQLVQYTKTGDWFYYYDPIQPLLPFGSTTTWNFNSPLVNEHFKEEIYVASQLNSTIAYIPFTQVDSIQITYAENVPISYREHLNYVVYIDNPIIEQPPYPWLPIEPPYILPYWDWAQLTVSAFTVYIPEEIESYKSLKWWSASKMGLFIFRQSTFLDAKKEEPILIAGI